jgi:glycosyltransferase involved in cell wall biosynthesis
MKKLKVALVYDAIYPYIKGGGEKRFYEIGARLVKEGMEVHLYGMKLWEGPKVIKRDGMYLHGIMKRRPLYNKSGNRTIIQAFLFGLACLKLFNEDLDVIDCCGFPYFSLFSCKIVTLVRRKALYATWFEVWGKDYWNQYLRKLGFIGYWVERTAVKLPSHIISTSEHTSDSLFNTFNIQSVVIPNGISLKSIKDVLPSKKHFDIIYVGRLMSFKNINLIFEALAQIKYNNKTLTCCIIGEGPAKLGLQNLAKDLGIADQINWLGFLEKSEDVYANIKASKMFILPSAREGFGIVAIEANACGVPVLTANYPANAAKDLIQEGVNGYVFKPETTELAKLIEEKIDNTREFNKRTVKVAKKYDWDILAKQLSIIYTP